MKLTSYTQILSGAVAVAALSCGFFSPSGEGSSPSSQECRIGIEGDCEAGEKCVTYDPDGNDQEGYSAYKTQCVEVVRNGGKLGDVCELDPLSGEDDCGAGLICFDAVKSGSDDPTTGSGDQDDGKWHGTCQAVCKQDGQAGKFSCEAGFECMITNSETVRVCKPSCSPYNSKCAEGEYCHFVEHKNGGEDFAYCRKPGLVDKSGLGYRDPCTYNDECADGLQCALASEVPNCADDRCCTPYCDIEQPKCPSDKLECIDLQSATFPSLGLCAIP